MPAGNDVASGSENTVRGVMALLAAVLSLLSAGGIGYVKLANQQDSNRAEFLQNSWTVEDMLKYAKLLKEECGCHVDPLDVLWDE